MAKADNSALIAQITAAVLAAQSEAAPSANPAKRGTRKVGGASRKPASKPNRRQYPATCISAGIAWEVLGADEQFKPKDPDKPATNAQLWNLNAKGLLTLAQ